MLHRRAQDTRINGYEGFLLRVNALVHDGLASFFLACRKVLRDVQQDLIDKGTMRETERFWPGMPGDDTQLGRREVECSYHFWKDIERVAHSFPTKVIPCGIVATKQ